MNAERVQLFALIGLRALAEYDPFEYKRCTELSKRQLEDNIQRLIERSGDDEARKKFEDLKTIETELENAGEFSFLLKQIYVSSLQKAQQLSLTFFRRKDREGESKFLVAKYTKEEDRGIPSVSEHDDLLRLSVTLLIRKIKGYKPLFHYRWKSEEIDCLLEPFETDLPFIVMESKSWLRSDSQIEMTVDQLSKYRRFWGKKALGIIVTKGIGTKSHFQPGNIAKNIFLLIYDPENNVFVADNFEKLLTAIRLNRNARWHTGHDK